MSKIKVHELAKEINKTSKEVLGFLQKQGIEVKSHMSNIEGDHVALVRKNFTSAPQERPTQRTVTSQEVRTKENQINRPASQPHHERPRTSYGNDNRNNQRVGNNTINQHTNNNQTNQDGNSQDASKQGENDQRPSRPQGSYQGQGNNQGQNAGGNRNTGSGQRSDYQNRNSNYQNRDRNNNQEGGQRPYNNNRYQGQGQGQGGQGQSQGGYQNRNNNTGNRPNQGNRPYQGNRPQGGGYSSDRPNQDRNNGENRGNFDRNNNTGNRPYNNNNNRPYNREGGGQYSGGQRPQGSGQYSGGQRPQGGGQYSGGQRPQGGGQYSGGQRPQGGGQYSGGQRPQGGNSTGGYNRNRPNNNQAGGNQGYRPRPGFDSGMNKDDDNDNNRRRTPGRADAKDTKKFDAPLGMSRSEASANNRKANKNVKNNKTNYGRKDIEKDILDDEITLRKKGQFIKPKPVQQVKEDEVKVIVIPEILTIKELAEKMKMSPAVLVKKLFLAGKMVSINQEITFEEAEEIAIEYEIIAEREVVVDVIEELLKEEDEDEADMVKRPPVVCVMGHVDHGKTSLLDAIRTTSVTSHEAGGITQHIGAYTVTVNGEKITFLDTPGHEAFTSMRMRGAKSTDIAILVVAADDGVMPQTVEAISHAKAAGIQIIVAVNKIDKPSANIERVKQELTEYELVAEDWGGDTIFVPVSAHTREGIEQLLEMIILTAEMGELKANPNRNARGIVIEAELDKGRGPVATILVQKGTLNIGDSIAIGSSYGKVRAMMDDKGRRVKEATPSTPVEILGLNEVPDAGEVFIATDTEKEARSIAETYISQGREKLLADTKAKLSLDGLFSQIKAGNIKELNIIVKADVQGSVEAMKQSLVKLSNDEVAVRIIHGGVGAINESDVNLAVTSNAIVIGFNVRPDVVAKETADREKVDLRLYRVIYSAIEEIEAAMKGMLDPIFEEKVIGHAEVRQVFKASGLGTIAGSYVLDGKIERGCQARIIRDQVVIYDGILSSLKRFKDDVKEVATGYECGLVFEKYNDVKEFDQVELYKMVEVPRK